MGKAIYLKTSSIKVNRNVIEWVGIVFVLVFSFINSMTLLISLGLILLLLFQKEIGAIKILNIITLRTIINPALAPDIGVWQNLKWLIIIGCSIYLVLSYSKVKKESKAKIKFILVTMNLFLVYNIFTSLVVSSLPIVSIFKVVSYILVFSGILIGVGYTKDEIKWLDWIFKLFLLLMLSSFFTLTLPIGYILNGSFQGLSNQPNMFGILAVLFLSLLLSYSKVKGIGGFKLITSIGIILLMVILSNSRTSLFSCIVILSLYILVNLKTSMNYLKLAVSSFTVGLLFLLWSLNQNVINSFAHSFISKGQKSNEIFKSREEQIGTLLIHFKENPIFGNGFMVPVLPFKSYEFSMEYVVEPGNIIISTLSFSGIVGFIIFIIFIFSILKSRNDWYSTKLVLIISPLIISMGEMVFFSSNNIGIWCYMLLAIYVFSNTHKMKFVN